MFVQPRGRRPSRTATPQARPSSVIGVRGNTVSAMSSKTTSARRSWSSRMCMTVFTACLTMSRIESPSSRSCPASSSYFARVPMDPEMSTTQHTSAGVRVPLPSGISTLIITSAWHPSTPTSALGATSSQGTASGASAVASVGSSGHSSSPSTAGASRTTSSRSPRGSAWGRSSALWASAGAVAAPSTPHGKTRWMDAMAWRQMGHRPEVCWSCVRQPSQPHWCPQGRASQSAGPSKQTTHWVWVAAPAGAASASSANAAWLRPLMWDKMLVYTSSGAWSPFTCRTRPGKWGKIRRICPACVDSRTRNALLSSSNCRRTSRGTASAGGGMKSML
mmetsp:Transcript_23879/g.43092  ORF Transcript_23879/g.43092 Transcript_23879/m.43092 type:complete len:334 (+) Transcript_23879:2444-3445(+)